MLVSIIIPCYNAEPYVADAIRSALDQSYPHKEVIVIDDGSTDGSLDAIRSFGTLIRWKTQRNHGGAVARNHGLQLAEGEVIQFLDADDLLDRTKIERQIELLRADQNSLVFCDARVVDHATGEPLAIWGRSSVSSADAIIYVLKSVLPTEAPLHWKANLQKVGGFSEQLRAGQDPDLHMRLACAGLVFRHLHDVLFTVRRVPESVSRRNAVRVLAIWRQSALEAHAGLAARGAMNEKRALAFAGYFANIARRYLRHNLVDEARQCFADARLVHPGGGISQAYGAAARCVYKLVGPMVTERLAQLRKRLPDRKVVE